MPPAYTSFVADNENFSFLEFAMLCARNFGALMMMRNEPLDLPVPERHHKNTQGDKQDSLLQVSRKQHCGFVSLPSVPHNVHSRSAGKQETDAG